MTRHDVASISCRVLAIYVLVQALAFVQYYITFWVANFSVSGTRLANFVALLPCVFLLILSGFLWFAHDHLATRISSSSDSESNIAVSALTLRNIAYSMLGLFLIADAIPGLLGAVMKVFNTLPEEQMSGYVRIDGFIKIFAVIMKLILGLVLFIGPQWLRRFTSWVVKD